jgi:Transglycosylase SLT domain
MDALPGIRYGGEIAGAARAHGLDPALLAAVAAQETGGPGSDSGANVVGDGGHGHGVFQIDDRYHAFATTPAAMQPAQNADYAAGLLSNLIAQNGGNVRAALSAYNAGSPTATGTVTAWPGGQQLGYADSVMQHYASIQQPTQQSAIDEAPTAVANTNALSDVAAQVPQLSIPAFTPTNWSFTSYSSEAGKGGGQQANSADQAMASLVDPTAADQSDRTESGDNA